jgi:GWxTD domain-containing protein
MKSAFILFFLGSLVAHGQGLREINFQHLYNHEEPVHAQIKPVRSSAQWQCFYSIILRDTSKTVGNYKTEWQVRNSLSDKEGETVPDSSIVQNSGKHELRGTITLPLRTSLQYLVAKVSDLQNDRSYYFFTSLEPNYPETDWLKINDQIFTGRFAKKGSTASIQGTKNYIISYYNDDFPTAPLAFSEAVGKVSKQMKVDSTFTIKADGNFIFDHTGLYLLQTDTTLAEGTSLRVEEDYPRYAKIKSIADPLVYICSSQEYNRIKLAKGEKKAFDKVILSITKDADRAKKLMKSYFKRVEVANLFFTSYKEGWKTDRGMIYIIFGLPDEVFRYADREVWNYKKPQYKINFEFIKSPSLFDPENYVLIRNKKYAETWYEVVDLWRNARF